jgi:hypothetical protein
MKENSLNSHLSLPTSSSSSLIIGLIHTENEEVRLKIECSHCISSFCSSCLSSPYHYHGNCSEIEGLTKAWYEWKQGKQKEYLKEVSQVSGYEGLYEEYQKKTNDRADLIAGQKYEEILANETEMSKDCKACPHCGAPVIKVLQFRSLSWFPLSSLDIRM